MLISNNLTKKDLDSVQKTVGRASIKFQMKDGTEAGDLVIENERLKTTVLLLQQKLQANKDTQEMADLYKDKYRKCELDRDDLN